jgi:hypothetical protein
MATGPGHELARRRALMRAADADREQAVDALKAAFAEGRLAKDDFETRVGRAFAARTYADLAAVAADIPPAPAPAPPRQRTARPPARRSTRKLALWCAGAALAAELVLVTLIFAVPLFLTVDLAVLANLVGLPLVGGLVYDTWRENRGRGQLPPPVLPDPRRTLSSFICIGMPGRPDWRP